MNLTLDASGQIERPQGPEPIDMFEHVPGVRLERRLSEPHQRRDTAAFSALEQIVQPRALADRQSIGQHSVDVAVGASDSLCSNSFDRIQPGKKDGLRP